MPKALLDYSIDLEVDPNPNGYPVLFMHFKCENKVKNSILLGKESVEELIKELQDKLKDM